MFVVSGPSGSGKTTTLEFLQHHYGLEIYAEAHSTVLETLQGKMSGHDESKPFTRISSPDHFCPYCKPLEFLQLVLTQQKLIESTASGNAVLDRSYVDAVQYFNHTPGTKNISLEKFSDKFGPYQTVFLFSPIEENISSRWGKSKAARIREFRQIEAELEELYRALEFNIVKITLSCIEERAKRIYKVINS